MPGRPCAAVAAFRHDADVLPHPAVRLPGAPRPTKAPRDPSGCAGIRAGALEPDRAPRDPICSVVVLRVTTGGGAQACSDRSHARRPAVDLDEGERMTNPTQLCRPASRWPTRLPTCAKSRVLPTGGSAWLTPLQSAAGLHSHRLLWRVALSETRT